MFATLLILSSKFIERFIISVNLLADIFRYFPCVWICSTSNWNLNAWRIWIPMISTPIYESFYFNIFENVAKFMITRSIRKMLTSWHSILITPTDISSVRVICVWACASVLMFLPVWDSLAKTKSHSVGDYNSIASPNNHPANAWMVWRSGRHEKKRWAPQPWTQKRMGGRGGPHVWLHASYPCKLMYVCIYTCVSMCGCVCMCVCIHIHISMFEYVPVDMCRYIHKHRERGRCIYTRQKKKERKHVCM